MVHKDHFTDPASGGLFRMRIGKLHPAGQGWAESLRRYSQAEVSSHRRQDIPAMKRYAHRLTPVPRLGQPMNRRRLSQGASQLRPAAIVRNQQPMAGDLDTEQGTL